MNDKLLASLAEKKNKNGYCTRRSEAWVAVLIRKLIQKTLRTVSLSSIGIISLLKNYLMQDIVANLTKQIVDGWFRTIAMQMLGEEGLETARGMGYINVVPIVKIKVKYLKIDNSQIWCYNSIK